MEKQEVSRNKREIFYERGVSAREVKRGRKKKEERIESSRNRKVKRSTRMKKIWSDKNTEVQCKIPT